MSNKRYFKHADGSFGDFNGKEILYVETNLMGTNPTLICKDGTRIPKSMHKIDWSSGGHYAKHKVWKEVDRPEILNRKVNKDFLWVIKNIKSGRYYSTGPMTSNLRNATFYTNEKKARKCLCVGEKLVKVYLKESDSN